MMSITIPPLTEKAFWEKTRYRGEVIIDYRSIIEEEGITPLTSEEVRIITAVLRAEGERVPPTLDQILRYLPTTLLEEYRRRGLYGRALRDRVKRILEALVEEEYLEKRRTRIPAIFRYVYIPKTTRIPPLLPPYLRPILEYIIRVYRERSRTLPPELAGVTISEIAREFRISHYYARRYLEELRRLGLLDRKRQIIVARVSYHFIGDIWLILDYVWSIMAIRRDVRHIELHIVFEYKWEEVKKGLDLEGMKEEIVRECYRKYGDTLRLLAYLILSGGVWPELTYGDLAEYAYTLLKTRRVERTYRILPYYIIRKQEGGGHKGTIFRVAEGLADQSPPIYTRKDEKETSILAIYLFDLDYGHHRTAYTHITSDWYKRGTREATLTLSRLEPKPLLLTNGGGKVYKISIDLDEKDELSLLKVYYNLKYLFPNEEIIVRETKRGYHIKVEKEVDVQTNLQIRRILGDDTYRLQLSEKRITLPPTVDVLFYLKKAVRK